MVDHVTCPLWGPYNFSYFTHICFGFGVFILFHNLVFNDLSHLLFFLFLFFLSFSFIYLFVCFSHRLNFYRLVIYAKCIVQFYLNEWVQFHFRSYRIHNVALDLNFYKTLTLWSCFLVFFFFLMFFFCLFFFLERDIKWEKNYIFNLIFNRTLRPCLGGGNEIQWKWLKRIILEYSSIPLFWSLNGGNGKLISLFESLSGREWNG